MVRSFFKKGDTEIETVSRGGNDYDTSTTHLRNNPTLIKFFNDNPNIILDGELYVHGWSLQKISGTCRLKTWEERCSNIEFWIFDLIDTNKLEMNFNERLDILNDLIEYFKDESQITVLEHEYATGWTKVKKLHDKFVNEGFEGLVFRKQNKPYSPGKRNSDWIKLKDYKDAEFKIIGISEKSRPEDFCFKLITSEGKEFNAKPVGTREIREEYLENWEDYVGKMATVKFFNWTTDKIPSQPIFKNVREEDE